MKTCKKFAALCMAVCSISASFYSVASVDAFASKVDTQNLEGVFGQAIENSPRLSIAKEYWNIGQSRTQQATAQLLPSVNLLGSFSQNRRYADENVVVDGKLVTQEAMDKYDGEKYTAQLRQVIFNWQVFSARGRAAYLEDQSEADYYDELSGLLLDVAVRYLDVLEAEDALYSVRSEKIAVEKQLQQVSKLYERQLVKVTDLYEAQARLAAIQADEIDAENQLGLSRVGLMELTGHEVGRLYRLDESAVIPPIIGQIQEWLDKANLQSNSLKSRRFGVRAAEKYVSEKRSAYMPQVSLIVQHQKSDIGYENTSSPRSETTYAGIDVTIPLFAGGASRAGVREAVSQVSIARSELLQVQRELARRIRAAYLLTNSNFMRTQAAQKLLVSTQKSSDAMRKGFSFGTVTSVDVLNAMRDHFIAERDLHKARYEHIKSLLQLKREAGVLMSQDLNDINSLLVAPE